MGKSVQKNITFDSDTKIMLEELDKQLNVTSNSSAVVRLAIKRLHEELIKK